MKRHVVAFLSLALAASAFAQNSPTINDTARFLAGLPVTGPLERLTQDAAWIDHSTRMNAAWKKKEYFQIGPISAWMTLHAPEYYRSSRPVYYMFSGPDFLYADIFFPNADTYILAGLEPVGQVPDLSRQSTETLHGDLSTLRGSMKTILDTHYFITKDMKAELARSNLGGTLPILYVFLARLDCTVLSTTYINKPAEGVKITFSRSGGSTQTLYYFKTDLSGGKSAFLTWCASHGPGLSLLKAASYLMHTEGFNGVRNFLLDRSLVIVQDDSGIPLRAFPKGWKVDCFGRYVPHAEMFGKYHQPDLAAIYAKDPPPPELGFAFGYHWQIERGLLMLATRR
jgi:hypothetical protein